MTEKDRCKALVSEAQDYMRAKSTLREYGYGEQIMDQLVNEVARLRSCAERLAQGPEHLSLVERAEFGVGSGSVGTTATDANSHDGAQSDKLEA